MFSVNLQPVVGASVAVDTMEVEIGADSGLVVSDIVLYDNIIGQDTRVMRDGIRLSDESVRTSRLNFRAAIRDKGAAGSVLFDLTGPVSMPRTMDGAGSGLLFEDADKGASGLVEGRYQLTATPFSEAGLGGTMGRAVSVSFVVVNAPTDPSSDASLASLTLSGIPFQFESGTHDYSIIYERFIPFVTVSAEPADSAASMKISRADSLALLDGHQVFLNPGANEIEATVTAEGGVTVHTYRIHVQRRIIFRPF